MSGAILDTDVFSVLHDDRPGAALFAAAAEGVRTSLAFPSIAELIAGARLAGWGPARVARLEAEVARHGVLMPSDELLWLCGGLRAEAVRRGHPLGHQRHANDLWIAACAVHYGVPLLRTTGGTSPTCPGWSCYPRVDRARRPIIPSGYVVRAWRPFGAAGSIGP